MPIPNSEEAELKRKLRSVYGKLNRRRTTMLLMVAEVGKLNVEAGMIERKLAEYKAAK